MYSYTWDPETGGILLNSTPAEFSKEPRPVFYQELDILGFDKFWKYEKDDSAPYMWAEATNYYYRGKLIAKIKGGSLSEKPELILTENLQNSESILTPINIDLMVEKNRALLYGLVQLTIKDIYNSYLKYSKKGIDVFYVAFSGGKDSIVTLDLVQKTLPHNSFKVLFGDTGMEFPDTYATIDYYKSFCEIEKIEFIVSKSEKSPYETWPKFGPPSTVNRWCCSVHKTTPQIVTLRKNLGKRDFTGMAFIGVRASESIARNEYDYISLGEKHKGQWSCNPILNWNSAELFLYLFSERLFLNPAYKKGNRRAGCLMCPRAAERSDYFSKLCYPKEFERLLVLIKEAYRNSLPSEERLNSFLINGGWKARKNGRDLNISSNYEEVDSDYYLILKIKSFNTDWKQWIKTIGVLQTDKSPYHINYRGCNYEFELIENNNGYEVKINNTICKENPQFIKLFKNVFRKAVNCVLCQTCEADCHHGALHMENDQLIIDDTCLHCAMCHKVEKGCLIYKSLEQPKGKNMNAKASLNCYSHHAPKMEWITQFLKYKETFSEKHSLGSNMYDFFKRFLKESSLLVNGKITKTTTVFEKLGVESESSWAIILINLMVSPQFMWFVKNINFDETYSKEYLVTLLINDGAKETWASDIWSAIVRFTELPFSKVGYGYTTKEGKKAISLTRTKWENIDPKVILYGLYKFAEACDHYYQFTLTDLLNNSIERDGISPTHIFGIEREEMISILNGLSINYPGFISATFTLDLDTINLREEKTSQDVLDLF